MRLTVAIAIALAACGKAGGSGAPPADPDAWIATCKDGLARAAKLPSWRRGRTIVDACRPCGVAWDPVLADPVPAPSKVVAVVDACKLDCAAPARSAFYAAISALEPDEPAGRAWLAFGKACPAVLGTPGNDGRYASGAWFALHQIARRLAAAHVAVPADLTIALPLWSQGGGGLILPDAHGALIDVLDAPVVTATASEQLVIVHAPRARLAAGGLVDLGPDWPGPKGDPLVPATLVAPTLMPVARVRALVAATSPSAIAVAPPRNEILFGGEVAGVAVPPGWPPASGTVGDAVKGLP